MAQSNWPSEAEREAIDDYLVESGIGERRRPVAHHVSAVVRVLLLILIAAVSLALFWVVGTLIGVV